MAAILSFRVPEPVLTRYLESKRTNRYNMYVIIFHKSNVILRFFTEYYVGIIEL